jgi:hypothetical protein
MAKIKVLGLSGQAGSGKDWIYENCLFPMGYKRWALADHFKIWAVGREMCTYEEVFHTKPPKVRKALQTAGTEEGRLIHGEDIWCKTALAWMEHLNNTWKINKFVISDIRFPNEVKFIQEMGGKVLRIEAPTRVLNSSLSEEARQHISETALNGFTEFDAIINNDPEFADTVTDQVNKALGIESMPHDFNEFLYEIFNERVEDTLERIDTVIDAVKDVGIAIKGLENKIK